MTPCEGICDNSDTPQIQTDCDIDPSCSSGTCTWTRDSGLDACCVANHAMNFGYSWSTDDCA